MRGEFEWIETVRRRVAELRSRERDRVCGSDVDARDGGAIQRPAAAHRLSDSTVRVGIGDDAAVLAVPAGHELVLTTDMLVEGVDFVLDGLDPFDLGWKALAVSVSDVAAMGARSAHAVVSVALHAGQTGAFADRLLDGLLACADRYGVALVGGDTSGTPGGVVVNVALTGFVAAGRAVLRSGARPGDAICVTGALGGSILGRHLRVTPRQDEALSLVQSCAVHAMIDLSDGLSSDLGQVLDASGAGAEVWDDCVPVHADAAALSVRDGVAPLEHAWSDGEDFELLFCVDDATAARLERDGLPADDGDDDGGDDSGGDDGDRAGPDDRDAARGGHRHGVAGDPGGASVPTVARTRVTRIGRVLADRAYVRRPSEGTGDARPVVRRGHDHFRRP